MRKYRWTNLCSARLLAGRLAVVVTESLGRTLIPLAFMFAQAATATIFALGVPHPVFADPTTLALFAGILLLVVFADLTPSTRDALTRAFGTRAYSWIASPRHD